MDRNLSNKALLAAETHICPEVQGIRCTAVFSGKSHKVFFCLMLFFLVLFIEPVLLRLFTVAYLE